MKKINLVLICLLLAGGLWGQTKGNNTTTLSRPVPFLVEDVLTSTPHLPLAPDTELRRAYAHQSVSETKHVKYHLFQEGLRVLGGTVVFHVKHDLLYATSGYLPEAGHSGRNFRLGADQAQQLALLRLSRELRLSSGLRIEETTRAFANAAYPRKGGPTVAVYIVSCNAETGPEGLPIDTDVVVNAASGRVLACLSNIHSETVLGHGDGFYLQDLTFPVDSLSADEYQLRDGSRGQGIFAFDISNNLRIPTDEDNEWAPELEGHQSMIDGYYGSVKFYDFLEERFDRNSIDDDGFPLVANMNRHTFVNAYWNGSETTYGNGNCDDYSPLTTLTIVGHEYAHGLTQFTSGLIYQDESGALNESISDILGKALQYDYAPDDFDWRIGSDIRRRSNVRYFRDMANPWQRNHPKLYRGRNWRTGPADAGGVHSNSGVFNHWFYLLVEGKKASNEEGVAYDVKEIGMDSALQLVYLLETAYLTENSGYQDCYDYSLLAAAELFGAESDPYTAVVEAWKAVGLPTVPDTDGGSIALNVLSSVYNPDNSFDFRLCPDELENLVYSVEDLPGTDEIPNGSVLNGSVVFSYFSPDETATVYDTILYTDLTTSPDNYSNFGELSLGLSYQLPEEVVFLELDGDFSITSPEEQTYTFTTSDFIFINELTEPELSFRFDQFGPTCEVPTLVYDYYSVDIPRCGGMTEGTIRMTFTNGSEELFIDRPLEEQGEPYVTFSPESDLDLSQLGSLNGISYNISFIQDGVEILILEDNYSRHFAEEIEEAVVYDFEDQPAAELDLGISFCDACPRDFSEGKLNFKDSSFIGTIEDCIPFDEFLGGRLGSSRNAPSSVAMCVDATGIDEPHLVFLLKQEESDEFNASDNQYLHLVDVYDDEGSILDEPITGTGERELPVEIPLAQDFSGTLTVHVISRGVLTTLDDLGITAGAPSHTPDLDAGGFSFRYTNPVSDRLLVTAASAVPAGSRATVFSASGREVFTKAMRGGNLELETQALAPGIYFLVITDGATFRWSGKVVRM